MGEDPSRWGWKGMTVASACFRAIEGTHDYVGEDADRFDRILEVAGDVFARYGYRKIYTPIFEATDLFARSIGAGTDIVEKEMYTFTPGSETITLRPEGTAGVVRAYLQHHLHHQGGLTKVWYAGPMFRRERPQKGRYRQFHQVGVEALGAGDPLLDSETIAMALHFYQVLGISDVRLRLNSIGCMQATCRPAFREMLRTRLRPHLPVLCRNCQQRFDRNLLRILDCKNPECQQIRKDLPLTYASLCSACALHFEKVQKGLQDQGIRYELDGTLVRGLDYYTRTVFEFTHAALGSQDAVGGGGRYDGLVEVLGGPPTPAVGFALGIERTMLALATRESSAEPTLDVYGIGLGEEARQHMAKILGELRRAGLATDMDYEGRSLKAQMRQAHRTGAALVLILGEQEYAEGKIAIKAMREGFGAEGEKGQWTCPLEKVVSEVDQLLSRRRTT